MNRFKFPGWPSINTSIEALASSIAAGKACSCLSGSPCSECRLAAAMASIANLLNICESMQKKIDQQSGIPEHEPDRAPLRSPITAYRDNAKAEAMVFLRWLQKNGVSTATSPKLSKLYVDYVAETDAPIVSQGVLRGQLIKIPGVTRTLENRIVDGKRSQPTVWGFPTETPNGRHG